MVAGLGANDAISRPNLPSNLKGVAAQEIRRQVFAGELRPGSKVDQEALAEQLGVSKIPIREALLILEHEGVIENVARRGAFVARLSRNDIQDHYRVFGVVSGLAAERAAKNMPKASLLALTDIADRMESGVGPEEQESLNFEFHRRINYAADSRRLTSILGIMSRTLPHGFYVAHQEWPEKAHEDHRKILRALTARTAARSRTAMEKHFADAGDHAVALLEAQGFWDH
ncbi:DNA-binding GntR family transcriptional regulator [Tamaricihabitans halophyticus]|uniref:DNA-binding GntR family transcriptional regulator n=1 Tax=Tamaricihabitans halophyticus TaxID=1262583 RepID=A0A4R2QP89_9PSEU|nr:GntR family transcriptional regulator [Tamaricihabitans halophyticus]TCP50749.1 DNA-binding GntR family transcriptional regulator [Tamaricihabitans halophyticus]